VRVGVSRIVVQPTARYHAGMARDGAERIGYLDGLRGLASLQVIGLHFMSGFFPALGQVHPEAARHDWERWFIHSPLFLPLDGFAAVSTFFIISGVALTCSFQTRPYDLAASLLRRTIRLGIPLAAGVGLGALLLSVWPTARINAGLLLGPGNWIGVSGPPRIALQPAFLEALRDGLFLGHVDLPTTLLPHSLASALALTPVQFSFDGPIWTLHLEFWGSVLVMLLVAARAALRPAQHHTLCLVLLLALAAHPLGLFVLGHLLAPVIVSRGWRCWTWGRSARCASILALVTGILAASYQAPHWLVWPFAWLAENTPLPAPLDPFRISSMFEAVLVFAAVMTSPPLQRLLCTVPARFVGRLSFSLYLVHFPVLLTVAAAGLVLLSGIPGASGFAIMAGVATTLALATAFERLVDRPAIWFSRQLTRNTAAQWRDDPGPQTG
jgi:peptidoglycan/LPS O-acetylase OafA/YrhL